MNLSIGRVLHYDIERISDDLNKLNKSLIAGGNKKVESIFIDAGDKRDAQNLWDQFLLISFKDLDNCLVYLIEEGLYLDSLCICFTL